MRKPPSPTPCHRNAHNFTCYAVASHTNFVSFPKQRAKKSLPTKSAKIGIYSEHGSAWISPDQTTERPGRECQSSSLGGV